MRNFNKKYITFFTMFPSESFLTNTGVAVHSVSTRTIIVAGNVGTVVNICIIDAEKGTYSHPVHTFRNEGILHFNFLYSRFN